MNVKITPRKSTHVLSTDQDQWMYMELTLMQQHCSPAGVNALQEMWPVGPVIAASLSFAERRVETLALINNAHKSRPNSNPE